MSTTPSQFDDPVPVGPRQSLSLLDATSIAVGIIIGSAIYTLSPMVIAAAGNLPTLLALWIAGGLVALVGALTYAELASTYPEEGGDYIYLRRAFGRRLAFVYAWSELWVVRPGSMGAIAYVFAAYFQTLLPFSIPTQLHANVWLAAGAIVVLAAINRAGIQQTKWTQYALTSAKLIGLFAIFAAAFIGPGDAKPLAKAAAGGTVGISGAMIFVVFAFGGWNDVVFVAAETHEPRRNIPKALLISLAIVATVYLAVNFAFVHTLGFAVAGQSKAIAADVLSVRFSGWGGRFVSALVCISALGSINGMILTRSRIYTAVGRDYPGLAALASWNPKTGTPQRAVTLQTLATLAPVVVLGLLGSGFDEMVLFTHPVFWFFFLLAGISLFVLRRRDPDTPRPYRVIGYPVVPALFCASCVYMLYAAASYAVENASKGAMWSVAVVVVGFAIAVFQRRE